MPIGGLKINGLSKYFATAPGPGPGWTPASISSLKVWLDASVSASITSSGGIVSGWADQSGNNANAYQSSAGNRPSYSATGLNSQPALYFNPDGDGNKAMFVDAAAGMFSTGIEVLSVFYKSGDPTTYESAPVVRSPGAPSPFDIYNTTRFTGSVPSIDFNFADSAYDIANKTSPQILGYQITPTSWNEYDNGILGYNSTNITSYDDNSTTLQIGARGDLVTGMRGYISEIIVTLPLSTTDRQKAEGYLAHKWGLAAGLASDHPYKVSPP